MDVRLGARSQGSNGGRKRAVGILVGVLAALTAALLLAVVAAAPAAAVTGARSAAAGAFVWRSPALSGFTGSNGTDIIVAGPRGSVYAVASVAVKWSPVRSAFQVSRLSTASGRVIWRKTFRGPARLYAIARGVAVDGHGNVVVAGGELVKAGEGQRLLVLKLRAADGRQLWARTLSSPPAGATPTDTLGSGVAVDGAGSVYVSGYLGWTADGSSFADAVALKYSSAGHRLWKHVEVMPGANEYSGIAVDAGRNVYLAGLKATGATPTATYYAVLTRLNASGDEVWSQPFTSALGSSYLRFVKVVGANVVAGGVTFDPTTPATPKAVPFAVKAARSSGSVAWKTDLDSLPGDNQDLRAFAVDGNGYVALAGLTRHVAGPGLPALAYMGWVSRITPAGVVAWTSDFYDDRGAQPYGGAVLSVACDASGRVYCGGAWARNAALTAELPVVRRYSAAGAAQKDWKLLTAYTNGETWTAFAGPAGVFAGGFAENASGMKAWVQRLKP
jgi:hypothetical protein